MFPLRTYQRTAIGRCCQLFVAGMRRVVLVMPTGSGKTRVGQEIVLVALRGGPVLWLAHRDELVDQAADALRELGVPVGIIKAGREPTPGAQIQVASVQTLLARDRKPPARVVVLDECHHYVSDDWGTLARSYDQAAIFGLTATPERGDGRPLGDLFDEIVVGANYPDLIEAAHLVPCKIIHPGGVLNGLAQEPVETYMKYGEGKKGFLFTGTVPLAQEYVEQFRSQGVTAECIHAKTHPEDRRAYLAAFKRGEVQMITNVFTMTEGIDVPDAAVAILARTFGHVSPYLQACGRVLRPAEGKPYAIIIDLPGNIRMHGSPIEARDFSLGEGICRAKGVPSLKVCPNCGYTYPPAPRCPNCGLTNKGDTKPPPRIFDAELEAVFDGPGTPEWAKRRELERLLQERQRRGWTLGAVTHMYENLFGERPELGALVQGDERKREYERLLEQAGAKGYAKGWAAYRFKASFGFFPPRTWEPSK